MNRRRDARRPAAILAAILFAALPPGLGPEPAQAQADPAGHWEGEIQVPGSPLVFRAPREAPADEGQGSSEAVPNRPPFGAGGV